jgi:cytochrome P450
MLFASHETTSIGLTAILKFLTDNPKALQELTVSKLLPEIEMVAVAFIFLCGVYRKSMRMYRKEGRIQTLMKSPGKSTSL